MLTYVVFLEFFGALFQCTVVLQSRGPDSKLSLKFNAPRISECDIYVCYLFITCSFDAV